MSERIRRPDLEVQEVSLPPYIVEKILPYLPREQEAGNLYYQSYKTDVAAQTGRNTAAISPITASIISASSTSFSCSEVRKRIKMGYNQVRGYGDLAHAEYAMARMAKRSFYNTIEIACAVALQDVDSPTNAISDPVSAIDAAATALRDKGIGRLALVCSNFNFVRLKNDPTVKARMLNTGVAIRDLEPRYITVEQLAAVLGVDEVLIGRDDLWHSGINAEDRGNIALVVLPNKEEDCAEAVQLGRTIFFDYDSDAEHFVMESWHDDEHDADVVDAKGLVQTKILNEELKVTIQCFATESPSESPSPSPAA